MKTTIEDLTNSGVHLRSSKPLQVSSDLRIQQEEESDSSEGTPKIYTLSVSLLQLFLTFSINKTKPIPISQGATKKISIWECNRENFIIQVKRRTEKQNRGLLGTPGINESKKMPSL